MIRTSLVTRHDRCARAVGTDVVEAAQVATPYKTAGSP